MNFIKLAHRSVSVIMVTVLLLVNFLVVVPNFVIEADAISIERDDGTWLFPLPAKRYNEFNDWAGCPGTGICGLCNTRHPSWGDDYHTFQAPIGHNGIDIGVHSGDKVLAAAGGVLYFANLNVNGRGYTAVIEHPINDEWSYYSVYQHLKKCIVANNTPVQAGDEIAIPGDHLHFGIIMDKRGMGTSLADMNGSRLDNVEGKGWLKSPGYEQGQILTNPAKENDAGYPTKTGLCSLGALKAHYGSVHYTFDPAKVHVGTVEPQYTDVAEGLYFIRNMQSGEYLSVDGGTDVNAGNVSVSAFTGGDEMQMRIQRSTSTDGYSIQPLCSASRMINVHADTVSSGKNVDIWNDTGDASQRWAMEATDSGYVIRSIQKPSCVITVDGTNVIVETYADKAEQKWELIEASIVVQYEANGDNVEGMPLSQTKMYGEALALSLDIPTRPGYTFFGWAADANATEPIYQAGDLYEENKELRLYAVWKCAHEQTVVRDALKESCHTEGYTGNRYCDACGEKVEEGTIIPILEHEKILVRVVEPTCVGNGEITYACDLCKIEYVEILEPTGEHEDTDEDGRCDYCNEKISNVTNSDSDDDDTTKDTTEDGSMTSEDLNVNFNVNCQSVIATPCAMVAILVMIMTFFAYKKKTV